MCLEKKYFTHFGMCFTVCVWVCSNAFTNTSTKKINLNIPHLLYKMATMCVL